MKQMPTVAASPERDLGIALLEFEGAEPIPNRDAVGYYYTIRRSRNEAPSRVAVLFSGTVFYISTDAFGLPKLEDKQTRFTVFAEAAIGDYLDEHGLPDHTPGGVPTAKIECFSPHFQAWQDRTPASDDEIEAYIAAHLFWSWQFAQDGWELGLADCLRLHQPMAVIQRLVSLGDGKDWKATPRPPHAWWLVPLPSFLRERRKAPVRTDQHAEPTALEPSTTTPPATTSGPAEYVFVDEVRIADLRRATSDRYDLRKLIALCEELNQAYRSQCYHSVAALTRALLDHVPPIFGVRTFAEVANNYAGSKSFKESMEHLERAARKIADMHLHTQVRQQESLPTRTQVNFSNEVDVLLAEIDRLLSPRRAAKD
jgi:hypothetical protein